MCGIAGVMYFDDREPNAAMLKNMTDLITHRGPNDSGIWIDRHIGLGFRRLSIIDIQEGHQPLANEDDSIWIIFNGEIYNYKALRMELEEKGHRFRTHSDTEVIVHLYEEYGDACVNMLRGMFAFVIWDKNKQELFGARDHFGIKPFYYTHQANQFVFGSEIKSIRVAEGVPSQLHTASLVQYLTFQYVPEPYTMFTGIMKLPPAHFIKLNAAGKLTIQSYWHPTFEPIMRPFAEYVEQIREGLKDSVKHHMVSDVERGCFLSSGIDSTAIAASMRKIEAIRTFSVGFDGTQNETIIAKQTADALGTQHYAKIITEKDFMNSLPKAIWHQDEPVADPSAIALYHVAQLAKEHVTVVLSGEGADELFGGYRIYREPMALRPIEALPDIVKRILQRIAKQLPASLYGRNYILRGTTPLEERFLGNAKIFSEDALAEMFSMTDVDWASVPTPRQITKPFYEMTKHLDPVTRMQHIDMNLWLPGDILMKADKMTMAHSLELRVPFLDKELFEVARHIPASYRIANGTTKHIFRKAMEGVIPEFILHRPKLGFPVPMRNWLQGALGDVVLQQIQASQIGQYINMGQIEKMIKLHRSGQADYARKIWLIYVFAVWHVMNFEQAPNQQFASS
jgi:asparagine synthase (glutamine-hydrolysing)